MIKEVLGFMEMGQKMVYRSSSFVTKQRNFPKEGKTTLTTGGPNYPDLLYGHFRIQKEICDVLDALVGTFCVRQNLLVLNI